MSTENSQVFTERVQRLRGSRSKADFARFLGVKPQVYQRYEEGRVPRHDNLAVISEKCGVSVDWLIGRSNETGKPYGTVPDGYTVQWEPQSNMRARGMARSDITALITEGVALLDKKRQGSELAHLCHYIMDLLHELANRPENAGTGNEETEV